MRKRKRKKKKRKKKKKKEKEKKKKQKSHVFCNPASFYVLYIDVISVVINLD